MYAIETLLRNVVTDRTVFSMAVTCCLPHAQSTFIQAWLHHFISYYKNVCGGVITEKQAVTVSRYNYNRGCSGLSICLRGERCLLWWGIGWRPRESHRYFKNWKLTGHRGSRALRGVHGQQLSCMMRATKEDNVNG